jgi:GAF domain-containing protein
VGDTGATPPPPNELERLLELARAITAATTTAGSLAGALEATVDELFALSGHQGVTGTLIDHEAREQVIVADRARRAKTAVGNRRPLDEGLIGVVVASHQQLLMSDAGDDPRYSWDADPQVFHSMLLTPVVVDGRCEAVLELADTERGRYGEADATLLRIAADQLAATLRGIRLREQSDRRARSLDVAARVAQSVAAATTVEQALELAARATHRAAGFRRVAATLVLDETGEQLHLVEVGPPRPFTPVRRPLGSGPIGIALTTQQPVRTAGEDGPVLVVPVVVEGQAVAALDVVEAGDTFDQADSALMTLVAEQLAAAWRSLRHRDESERRAHRLALASEVAKLVTSAGPLDEMLRDVARTVCAHTGYDSVTIAMADRAAGEQVYVADESRREPSQAGLRRPLDAGICGRTLRTGLPFRSGRADGDHAYNWESDEPYRSAIVTPVNVDGECVAAVGAWTQEQHRFDAWDQVTMETIAEQLAIAISARRLREQSERRAHRLALSLDVARAIVGADSIDATLQAAVNALFGAVECTTVNAVRADGDEQVLVAVQTAAGGRPIGLRRPRTEGMSGHVFATGQIVRESSQPPSDRISRWTGEHNHESGLIVPVLVDGAVMAVLELYDVSTDRFEAQDELLMRAVAEQVAAAIRGVELREASDRRARRLALAAEVARAVTGAGSIDEALDVAARTLFEGTGYQHVAAVRCFHERGEMMLTVSYERTEAISEVGSTWPIGERIAGRVAASRAPVRLGNAPADPDYSQGARREDLSIVYVPVVVDGRCEALLQLASSAPDAFTADDEALMVTVAEQVAAALRGARLRSESEQRARRLALASDIARRIAAAESADDVVRTAVRLVHESTGCTSVAGIRLSSDRSEQIFTAVIDGRGDTRLEGRRRPPGEGLVGVALSTARQVSVGRSSLSDIYAWPGEPRLESLIVTPVLVDGVCVAALHVADVEPDRFDETEASLLRAVAEQVAAALRGARLRAESEQRAGRLAVTLQVATAVAGERTVDSTLRAAVRAIAASIEAHAFSAFVPLPETGEQECVIDVDPTGGVEAERRPLEGVTTGAVLTGTGQVNIGDVRTHDGYRPWREDSAYRSVLLTPVVVDDHVAAAIGLYSLEPHRFNADDAVLMRTLAEQVAAALRGARLRDESERRARRLAVTLDVARAVADAPAIEDALRSAVETVADAIHCGSVAGFMALPETVEQLCVIDIDRHGASVQGMRQPQFAGHNGIVFRTGRQLHLRKQDDAPPGLQWTADDWEYQSAVFTPVQLVGHTVAVITLTDTAVGRFDDDDALLMRTVAEQLAAALRGASLRDESERRARRLALTLEVAKAVATAATPVETLRSAVEAIDTHIDCGAVAAFLAERETEEQVSIVDIDRHGNSTEGMRRSMEEGTTGRVFETGRQLVLGSSEDADGFVPWRESGSVYESVLITPVAVDGRCDAVLGLYDITTDRFDAEDALLMETVAEQVAAALRGARLRDQSESRARRLEALERRQRELLARLVRAQEQERTQVAGDLHDDTVQVLSACVIALDRVRHAIEAGELDRASASLRQAASLVSGAVERTRRMTFELRPAMLWQHGLEPAVRHLLDALARETPVEVRLDIGTLPGRLDSTVEAIAFRSISELIANVRTHAEAQQVVISLSADDGRLEAEVLDDGRGFNLEQALERARATNHLGLEALTERIDAAGGSVEIVTSPGDGTRVSLSLPLRTASAA